MSPLSRRRLLIGASALAAGSTGLVAAKVLRQPPTRVAVLAVPAYTSGLTDTLTRGLREFPELLARARGVRVVLKPNLVEYSPERPINTNPALIGALAEAFLHIGAAEVVVAEGAGHRRDVEALVEMSGLAEVLSDLRLQFVDLNADRTRTTTFPHDFTGFGRLELAATAAGAPLLVPVAKMKTHHWAGVTLTMKNLFGTVPGAVYGWPKNPLHWAGIHESIADLWTALRPGFAVIDGVEAMEGDGPIMGSAVPMGCVLMGESCPAVDATAARLMGVVPERIRYLDHASWHGGTVAASRISVIGDAVAPRDFRVHEHLRSIKG